MRAARSDRKVRRHALLLAGLLVAVAGHASDLPEPICEYRTLEIDERTGDIRFISPEKIGPEDCTQAGAASIGPAVAWRADLPPRVQWRQHAQAAQLCQSRQSDLGQRVALLETAGCVFLQPRQMCTIVAAQALSHAQLANAVRQCAP